jgi:periplasmic copper chaperone A
MPSRPEGKDFRALVATLSVLLAGSFALPAPAQTNGIAMGTAPASATLGAIAAENGYVTAMPTGTVDGTGFLRLRNTGTQADRLIALSSPSSREVELRERTPSGDPALRPLERALELPPGQAVVVGPETGLRLVFVGASRPFATGSQVALTLTFEKAGRMALTLPVLAASAP